MKEETAQEIITLLKELISISKEIKTDMSYIETNTENTFKELKKLTEQKEK